ncbi:MAG: hypothetical protein FWD61_08065 [Phycisphaerales bacterium]|nr:hypothetical protein [Phycisphaerales bacterium]
MMSFVRFGFHWMILLLVASVVWAQGVLAQNTSAEKIAPPNAAAITRAAKLVNEVYGDELSKAKTGADRIAIARKLGKLSGEEKNSDNRYAMLVLVKNIAAENGDIELGLMAVETIGKDFEIDKLKMLADTATDTLKSLRSVDQRVAFVTSTQGIVDRAIDADRYDVAKAVAESSSSAATGTSDIPLRRQATSTLQRVREIEAEFNSIKSDLAILDKSPNDPGASFRVGKFRCFQKGEWEQGLVLLSQGSDQQLKTLVQKELKGEGTADDLAAIGDAWWDLAEKEKGIAQEHIRLHAAECYRKCVADLTGLAKARVEKRIADFAPLSSGSSSFVKAAASKTVTVKATVAWTEVMNVKVGQVLEITATGEWRGSPNGPLVDASGRNDNHPHTRGLPHMSLIGKIGEYGTRFTVGTKAEIQVTESGPLFLGPNEGSPDDNSGELQVKVTIKQAPQALVQVRSVNGTIPATKDWTQVVEVKKGQVVTVAATGRWSMNSRDKTRESGPDGLPLPTRDRVEGPFGMLVGKIGNGQPFVVGANKEFIVQEDGMLYFGPNDRGVGDNEGELKVTVKVQTLRTSGALQPVQQPTSARVPQPPPIKETSVTVKIPANTPWTKVGEVKKGQVFEITAEGVWNSDTTDPKRTEHDADGCAGRWTTAWTAEHPEGITFQRGALIGKVGDRGKYFFMGKTSTRTVESDGTLFLGPYRPKEGKGELKVTLTLKPDVPSDPQNAQSAFVLGKPVTITVPANKQWTKIGEIKRGQVLEIRTATGVWSMGPSLGNSDAGGIEKKLIGKFNTGALIAKWDENGEAWCLGKSTVACMDGNGRTLFLGPNDTDVSDNKGELKVTVTLIR